MPFVDRDYDKGLQAMKQALSYAKKSESTSMGIRMASLNERLDSIQAFVEARQIISGDPQQAINICQELLNKINDHQVRFIGLKTCENTLSIGSFQAQSIGLRTVFNLPDIPVQ